MLNRRQTLISRRCTVDGYILQWHSCSHLRRLHELITRTAHGINFRKIRGLDDAAPGNLALSFATYRPIVMVVRLVSDLRLGVQNDCTIGIATGAG